MTEKPVDSRSLEQIAEQLIRDFAHCDFDDCGHCSEMQDAILSALSAVRAERQEEETQSLRAGSTVLTQEPEATPESVGCPCGLSGEPWHWPRGGVCTVGAQMPMKGD